jgi:hypothetical protein
MPASTERFWYTSSQLVARNEDSETYLGYSFLRQSKVTDVIIHFWLGRKFTDIPAAKNIT